MARRPRARSAAFPLARRQRAAARASPPAPHAHAPPRGVDGVQRAVDGAQEPRRAAHAGALGRNGGGGRGRRHARRGDEQQRRRRERQQPRAAPHGAPARQEHRDCTPCRPPVPAASAGPRANERSSQQIKRKRPPAGQQAYSCTPRLARAPARCQPRWLSCGAPPRPLRRCRAPPPRPGRRQTSVRACRAALFPFLVAGRPLACLVSARAIVGRTAHHSRPGHLLRGLGAPCPPAAAPDPRQGALRAAPDTRSSLWVALLSVARAALCSRASRREVAMGRGARDGMALEEHAAREVPRRAAARRRGGRARGWATWRSFWASCSCEAARRGLAWRRVVPVLRGNPRRENAALPSAPRAMATGYRRQRGQPRPSFGKSLSVRLTRVPPFLPHPAPCHLPPPLRSTPRSWRVAVLARAVGPMAQPRGAHAGPPGGGCAAGNESSLSS